MIVYKATKRQALFHAAPEMFKLYGGAMGGGKTTALCAEVIALSEEYPGNRGYICRHELKSFERTTGPRLFEMLSDANLIAAHNGQKGVYTTKRGSEIWYGGLGDDKSAIERLKSMELGWFAIDEASETTESHFFMLLSRLRLKRDNIRYFGLLASNPDAGWLKHRFIDQKIDNHVFVAALPTDNPHLPAGYVEQLRANFPPEWQARFIKGDWTAFEGINVVFPFSAIQAALLRDLARTGVVELGVDCARYGDDESVIAAHDGPVAEIADVLTKSDLMTLTGHVVLQQRTREAQNLKVDADGLGSGVVDRLRELGHSVSEIHGGSSADDSERFKNKKAEIYWSLRDRMLDGRLSLPDDMTLTAQFTSITYKINSQGQIEITSKDEMKRKGLKSPDRAEAVIYAFASSGANIGFEAHA